MKKAETATPLPVHIEVADFMFDYCGIISRSKGIRRIKNHLSQKAVKYPLLLMTESI